MDKLRQLLILTRTFRETMSGLDSETFDRINDQLSMLDVILYEELEKREKAERDRLESTNA